MIKLDQKLQLILVYSKHSNLHLIQRNQQLISYAFEFSSCIYRKNELTFKFGRRIFDYIWCHFVFQFNSIQCGILRRIQLIYQ